MPPIDLQGQFFHFSTKLSKKWVPKRKVPLFTNQAQVHEK